MDSTDRPEQKQLDECIALGNAAFSRDQLVEATTRFAQARMMLKQSGISDSAQLRHCLKTLFQIYTKREKPEEALEIIQALRKLDDTLDHRRTYVALLYQIAKAYEKQADRERAEEAYGEALVEATELLPTNDPLIGQLNTACIEIFKRTFKSKKLTVSDTQVRLSRLPTDQPIEETSPPTRQQSGPANIENQALSDSARSGSRRAPSSGAKLQMILQSNVISIGLSLLLIASLIKAALSVPAIQSATREAAVISKIQGQQFESSDHKKTFCILDKHQCAITKPHLHARCPYTVIENKWQDVSTMLRGYLTRDELWYDVNETTVIDPDKTVLYRTSAPGLVTASDPKRFYVIGCKDGANVTQAKVLPEDGETKSGDRARPQRVYICSGPEQEAAIRSFRSFSCITAWIWAILAGFWCLSAYKLKQSSMVRGASIALTVITCCALAGWYLLAIAHD